MYWPKKLHDKYMELLDRYKKLEVKKIFHTISNDEEREILEINRERIAVLDEWVRDWAQK